MGSLRVTGQAAVSIAIVAEVADRTGADPAALDPLYETIDPDAIDALLERRFEGRIEFEYAGFEVRVEGDGTIDVAERGDDRPPDAIDAPERSDRPDE